MENIFKIYNFFRLRGETVVTILVFWLEWIIMSNRLRLDNRPKALESCTHPIILDFLSNETILSVSILLCLR